MPAQLFTGSQSAIVEHTTRYLQEHSCPHNICAICSTCLAIRNKQYHMLLWISSEKTYTREDLAPVFQTLEFMLDPQKCFFIVIEKADQLTPACANSLLKSLEEPPHGYHFILLTDRIDQVLLTVRSRCIIQAIYSNDTLSRQDPFFAFFTNTVPSEASSFLKALDKEKLSESHTRTLIDQLFVYWTSIHHQSIISDDTAAINKAQRVIHILKAAMQYPPMPGSSKLILKNLYLQINVQ